MTRSFCTSSTHRSKDVLESFDPMRSYHTAVALLKGLSLLSVFVLAFSFSSQSQAQTPEQRFLLNIEKVLEKGQRCEACSMVLKKYRHYSTRTKRVDSAPDGTPTYHVRWLGKVPRPRRPRYHRRPMPEKIHRYEQKEGSLLYAYCVLRDSEFRQKADTATSGLSLLDWAKGSLASGGGMYNGYWSVGGISGPRIDGRDYATRYAEFLADGDASDREKAKALLQSRVRSREIRGPRGWLAWAKVMKAEAKLGEVRVAMARCAATAKSRARQICKL